MRKNPRKRAVTQMTGKEKLLAIELALATVKYEIRDTAHRGGKFAAGLASEGYAGGYRDALEDALLLFRSGYLPTRRNYWEEYLRQWMLAP